MDKIIGAQLYSIRDHCETKEDFANAIESLKNMGYKHVQVSGIKVDDAEFIKETCDKNGIEISCTHRGLNDFLDNFDEEVKRHKIYGCKYAGIGGLAGELRETKETFMKTIEKLNDVYDRLSEHGITFTYHNHLWEFGKLDDKRYMDYMLEYGKFSILADLGWMANAGVNPVNFLKENKGRIDCVHYKDITVVEYNTVVATEIGHGNLDWVEITKACDEAGVKLALVEQDTCPGDSLDSMEMSYKYLKSIGFN